MFNHIESCHFIENNTEKRGLGSGTSIFGLNVYGFETNKLKFINNICGAYGGGISL